MEVQLLQSRNLRAEGLSEVSNVEFESQWKSVQPGDWKSVKCFCLGLYMSTKHLCLTEPDTNSQWQSCIPGALIIRLQPVTLLCFTLLCFTLLFYPTLFYPTLLPYSILPYSVLPYSNHHTIASSLIICHWMPRAQPITHTHTHTPNECPSFKVRLSVENTALILQTSNIPWPDNGKTSEISKNIWGYNITHKSNTKTNNTLIISW